MSDNHDLLNDKDVCSFEEHEAENVCSNKDAVACGDCLSFVPIKIKINFLKMKKVGNHSVRKISERTIVEVLKHFKMIQEK